MCTVRSSTHIPSLLAFFIWTAVALAGQNDSTLKRAEVIFGPPLNPEHHVYQINDTYVAWLISDESGDLFEVDVGPRIFYQAEFPNERRPEQPRYLSEEQYRNIVANISAIKRIGQLQEVQTTPTESRIVDGFIKAEYFDNAIIETVLLPHGPHQDEQITRFNVHYLQITEGSPTEIALIGGVPQVCLGSVWYYVPSVHAHRLTLGKWQRFPAAGPNLNGRPCIRTSVRYDADGFTIEEPQNELVEIKVRHSVRTIRGRVHLAGTPLKDVRVEILRLRGQNVLRTKTNSTGQFDFGGVSEGEYKFKLTKDGFKAVIGKIVVDTKARNDEELLFELPLGT